MSVLYRVSSYLEGGRKRDAAPYLREEAVARQFDTLAAAAGYADAHQGHGSWARFSRSRRALVADVLATVPGGDLLDVGCGPGLFVRDLIDSRPGDFRITALDRSPAMVEACLRRAGGDVAGLTGCVENIPLPDAGFDVVLALGVLEYTDVTAALAEIARVCRPGGRVLVTMLNPMSPYRFAQFHLYWPLLRALRAAETFLGVPPERRHGQGEPGIRAYRARTLRQLIARAGLRPAGCAYFDATLPVPPIDRIVRRRARGKQPRTEQTGQPTRGSRGWRKWFGTAYLVTAYKDPL